MNNQCVVGVFEKLPVAHQALQRLESEGYSEENVSLVTSNVEKQTENPEILEYGDRSGERAAQGAGVGAMIGALLGSPLLMVPGIGPILMAGPIAAGGVVGGLTGAMTGWGVKPDTIEQYEQSIREGKVLVVVEGAPDEVSRAHELLVEAEADEVTLFARTSADAPEIDDRPTSDRV